VQIHSVDLRAPGAQPFLDGADVTLYAAAEPSGRGKQQDTRVESPALGSELETIL